MLCVIYVKVVEEKKYIMIRGEGSDSFFGNNENFGLFSIVEI